MNQIYGERFVVKSLRDDYELSLNPNEDKNIESVKEAIDQANIKTILAGYGAKQYLICKKMITKVREDWGQFAMCTVVTVAVEKYPAELKEDK